jgi:hypothetical protein
MTTTNDTNRNDTYRNDHNNDSSKNLTSKMVSELDQATAAYISVAGIVSAYYVALIESGMPLETAATLTKDMNVIWWQKLLNGMQNNTPPTT